MLDAAICIIFEFIQNSESINTIDVGKGKDHNERAPIG
jgi:hypothetical protein